MSTPCPGAGKKHRDTSIVTHTTKTRLTEKCAIHGTSRTVGRTKKYLRATIYVIMHAHFTPTTNMPNIYTGWRPMAGILPRNSTETTPNSYTKTTYGITLYVRDNTVYFGLFLKKHIKYPSTYSVSLKRLYSHL